MMLSYDHLIDTREKRSALILLIFLGIAIVFLVPYVILGGYLVTITSYGSLYSLLQLPILGMCYLSRLILDAISLTSVSIGTILSLLWKNISTVEVLMIIAFLLASSLLSKNKKMTGCLSLLLGEAIAALILMTRALSLSSLAQAITYVRIIGGIFIVCNTLLLILLLIAFLKGIKRYHQALSWQIEEIKEHVDQ